MSVDAVRKGLYVVAVVALLGFFCGYAAAFELGNDAGELSGLLLAQQSQESADRTQDAPKDEILKQVGENQEAGSEDEYDDEEDEYADDEVELIADPMIGGNVQLYAFNDKMYFLVLKPVAQVYGAILPEELRVGVVNFFYNIRFPVRFINCLLQGKVKKAGQETGQFVINTLWGFLGLGNVAAEFASLQPSREDLGQTFAVWGAGHGDYIMLPFLGPSSVRDALGRVGDMFLDPIWWVPVEFWVSVGIRAGEAVNETSTRIGEYEALKEAAFDPYVMIRNAYVQNRNKLIASATPTYRTATS
jgi:phospholipid-binding lipoprotein MlaA